MIRLAVVDDHPVVRQGIVAALGDEEDFQIVGSAASAEEALDLVQREAPDVLLLDLELPGLSGLDALPLLLERSPTTSILVFTAYDTDERVLRAVRSGAKGYLLKGESTPEIAGAIRAVAAGGSAMSPRIASKVLAAVNSPRRPGDLTPREREVLQLIAAGQASKQVALALGISERTVKFHTASLFRKLQADNRAQAVARAAQLGLLDGTTG